MSKPRLVGCAAVSIVVLVAGATAQAQSLAWARSGGGLDVEDARAVAVDADGNTYVTGIFGKSLTCPSCGLTATFGAGQPNPAILTPVGGTQDVYIAKYDSDGLLLWARGAGGFGPDEGYGLAVDDAGNSYITGSAGAADFGDGVTFAPPGGFGVFVAKYDSDGHAQWVAAPQPAGNGFGIAVDSSGNTYAGGYAPDPVLGGFVVTLWKVSANGTPLWSRQATGNYFGGVTSIGVDAAGNSYVTGNLSGGTALFGPGEPNQTPVTDTGGGGQMFLAKYDGSGNLVWAKQSADLLGLANGLGVSIDSAANIYVCGYGTTVLGLGEPNQTPIDGNFIARYNSLGQLIWAKPIIGSFVSTNDVATDPAGNPYITGGFGTSVTFAPGEPNQTTLLAGFLGADMFVAKYTPDGAFVWARDAGPGTAANSVALDSAANVSVVGIFLGDSTFGTGEPTETVLTALNPGYADLFVAKYLNDSPPPANHAPVAHDQTLTTPVTTPIAIVLTGHDDDGDPLHFDIVADPSHGVVTGSGANRTYTPHTNFTGVDSFAFTASDGMATSLPATISIRVEPTGLACGALTSGTILAAGEVDQYSFFGSAGQIISFALATTGGFAGAPGNSRAAQLTLVSPAGVVLGFIRSNSQSNFQLPESGAYTVRVGARDRTTTGSYNFNLECLLPPFGAVPLSCGAHRSGTIAAPGQVDLYALEGLAGRIVSLAIATTGGFAGAPGNTNAAELTLFSPAGLPVGTIRSNSQGNFVLPLTGTYVARVSARNLATIGSYSVNLECLVPADTPPAIPLQCGVLRSGIIAAPAEVDVYTLQGQPGHLISLALASTGGFAGAPGNTNAAELTVFTPAGVAAGTVRSNSQATFALAEAGTFVVRVSARNLGTTGTYNLSLSCLSPASSPPAVALTCGAAHSGTLEAPARVDIFTFDGLAGAVTTLSLISTGGLAGSPGSIHSAELTLFAPSGAPAGILRSNRQGSFTLPANGSYVVRVSARDLGTIGSYALTRGCS